MGTLTGNEGASEKHPKNSYFFVTPSPPLFSVIIILALGLDLGLAKHIFAPIILIDIKWQRGLLIYLPNMCSILIGWFMLSTRIIYVHNHYISQILFIDYTSLYLYLF